MNSPCRPLILAAALAASLCAPAAAVLNIAADTDRNTVEIDGNLYLTVTVSGDSANVPEPDLPNMQNFNVYSSGRSQSISIINGRITTSVSFTYILTPRFLGPQTIPPIAVSTGKEKAVTPEIKINVVKATARPQPKARPARRPARPSRADRAEAERGEQLFLKAETDRKSAYPGEQINLSVKFYTAVPLSSNPQYMPPSFKNIISEDLPPARNGETDINGVRYSYSEIKSALFALAPGTAEIRPATVVAQVASTDPIDPFDPNFFQKMLAGSAAQGRSVNLATDLVRLTIKPFPAGAPKGFNGAVGDYLVTASADRAEPKAGEAVNFSITVSGRGNLKAVTAPKFPDLPDFKVFDTMSSLDVNKKGDVITGKKTFTYILVPRSEGKKTVPPIKFTFFDPKAGVYRTRATGPVTLKVKEGAPGAKSVNFGMPGAAPVKASGSDIRYASDETSGGTPALLASSVLELPWWIHSVPAALLALCFWLARFNRFKLANPLLFRFRRARSEADRDIAKAEGLLKSGKRREAVSVLYDSFLDYLSDKCGAKISALPMRKALDLIKSRFPSVQDVSLSSIRALWETLELHRYSPGAAGGEGAAELVKKYRRLLMILEKELKK